MLADQVHGTRVVRGRPGDVPEADALWTDAPGVWVGIRTADCVPILLGSEDGARVAAVHSGWRGTMGGIAEAAVDTLGREGPRPGALRAAIGPCIGVCCCGVRGTTWRGGSPTRSGRTSCSGGARGPTWTSG